MKQRSKKSVRVPTSSTSRATAVRVSATPSTTTWRPGSCPTCQNAPARVTRLNLGPNSGALCAARRGRGRAGVVVEQLVERRVARRAGDVVEQTQLGGGGRSGHGLDLSRALEPVVGHAE